ncbi:MAG: helix-turn-helix domain-containing protein [Acidothermus sp.]|nr:helix-turn-helix domain-containing protein [Acidothermus sp.]
MASMDQMTEALEETADAARKSAARQQEIADMADEVVALHRTQDRWNTPPQTRQVRLVLTILATCVAQLTHVLSRLRRAWASTLLAEGLSLRQIARHFGVSHQRVSALLAQSPGTRASFGGYRATSGADDEGECPDEYRERGNLE